MRRKKPSQRKSDPFSQKAIRQETERLLKLDKTNAKKCKTLNDLVRLEQKNIRRGYQKGYAISKSEFERYSRNTMKVLQELKNKYCNKEKC